MNYREFERQMEESVRLHHQEGDHRFCVEEDCYTGKELSYEHFLISAGESKLYREGRLN